MIYYHYSVEEYDELKSKVAQGKGTIPNLPRLANVLGKMEGPVARRLDQLGLLNKREYNRSISLFLEKIPLDIASIYGNAHKFWISGLELYEHAVVFENIPGNIVYKLTESPKKVELLYEKQDWTKVEGNPQLLEKYLKEIKDMETKYGYAGEGIDNMLKSCRPFKRDIRKRMERAYELALEYPEDKILEKYAACVPHLMIYPGYRPIKVSSVKKITLK